MSFKQTGPARGNRKFACFTKIFAGHGLKRLVARSFLRKSRGKVREKDLVGAIDRNRPGCSGEPPLPCDRGEDEKTQPMPPKSKLAIQNLGRFVSAEIAAMAIAIWNMVTPRAKTSCL